MKFLQITVASVAWIAACGAYAGAKFSSVAPAPPSSSPSSQGSTAPATGVQGSNNTMMVPPATTAPQAPTTLSTGSSSPYSAVPGAPYNPANTPATLPGQQIPLPGPPALPPADTFSNRNFNPPGSSTGVPAPAFNDLDRDGDGRLSRAESGLSIEQFNRRDTNHDGVLSPMEYSSQLP